MTRMLSGKNFLLINFCIATLLVFVGVTVVTADEPTPITDCLTIDTPGAYVLANDISASDTCITVATSSVSIDGAGYTITGDSDANHYGIYSTSTFEISLTDIQLATFGHGVHFEEVSSSTISGVDITTSYGYGMYLAEVDHTTISDSSATSTVSVSGDGHGIMLVDSSDNTISNSEFAYNQNIDIAVWGDSQNNEITENTFTESYQAIDVNACPMGECEVVIEGLVITNNTINNPNNSAIELDIVDGAVVTGNDISEASNAVYLYSTTDSTISDNTVIYGGTGVYVEGSSTNNTISENDISFVDTGVSIWEESDDNVIDANIIDEVGSGFFIDSSDNNEVTDNVITLSNNNYGSGSSSPLVFTWNGEIFDYIADVGRGIPRNMVGTDFVQIPSASLVANEDDKYEMKISQEYNEIVYYDELALMTFDHESGYEVVTSMQRSMEGEFVTIADEPSHPLESCTDLYGNDCLADLEARDNLWSYKDESNVNSWEMNFGDLSGADRILLVIDAARDYSLTSADLKQIQVKDADGNWVNAYSGSAISSPGGSPRRQVIDLTGKFAGSDYSVKFGYDRTRVNYVAIDTSNPVDYTVTTHYPESVDLQFHGYSAINKEFFWDHNYQEISQNPPEQFAPQTGNFTKYGEVKPLLEATDDQFVIMHHGDQMSVTFDYEAPASGTERSFILYNWATFKHAKMGPEGLTVLPLPFEGMTAYPYSEPEEYPMTEENQKYLSEWNTRKVIDETYGMALPNSVNTLVSGNTIVNSPESEYIGNYGIYVYDELSSTVTNNTISGFDTGIFIEDSSEIIISENNISTIDGDGIRSYNVEGLEISDNVITGMSDDGDGIFVEASDDVIIDGNDLEDIEDDAIFIETSNDVVVSNNTATNIVDDGIDIQSSGNFTLNGNSLDVSSSGVEIDGEYVDPNDIDFNLTEAQSGTHVWHSTYIDDSAHTKLSRTVDLSAATTSASLSFYHWSYVETCCDGFRVIVVDETDSENTIGTFQINDGSWTEETLDLTDYIGQAVTLRFDFFTDGSVLYQQDGVYIDDVTISADEATVFFDDMESGTNDWIVTTESGQPWELLDLNPTDDEEVIYVRDIYDNEIVAEGTGVLFEDISGIEFINNTIQSDKWVSDFAEGTVFNDEDSGNTYYFTDGRGAWEEYEILDTDKNGYADEGEHVPFGEETLTVDRWEGEGIDEHPATETKKSGRRGGSVKSRVKSLNAMGKTDAATELKEEFAQLFTPSSNADTSNGQPSFGREFGLGDTGSDVRELQRFLNSKGYVITNEGPGSPGNETERFGELTRAALIKFQQDNNLQPAIGYFGPLTRALIASMSASTPASTPTASDAATPARDLDLGMSGDDVIKLQGYLIAQDLGPAARALKDNGVTGYFGELTKAAVTEFQQAKGITPTNGRVGPMTRGVMAQ